MQISGSHKTKQFLALAIKVAILIGAAYFIYDKLANNAQLDFDTFLTQLETSQLLHPEIIFGLLIATFFNWFLEIVKWKTLVNAIKPISLWESTAHTLGGLTASLFTPNRVGEYGAKALYFEKSERKRVVGLNVLGNLAQLLTTVFFGVIGLTFFVLQFGIELPWNKLVSAVMILMVLSGIFLLVIKQKRFQIGRFSWERIRSFLRNVSGEIHVKNLSFSVMRYVIFSHQLYVLLLFFGLNTSYVIAMSVITAMYLITSLIPMLFIFDVVVKGSVAVWLFGYLNVSELHILSVISLMWLLNFVLPSIVGSYFVLKFTPVQTSQKPVVS
ncbi:lysylphosphatidylglycerol synthase TM region [Kordia sp. SMS9]|uniref:lysylphosphatidylglycerol synthase domain-containing protein n=1 Tax=Kordia sp. SMS9 TaxID=2282170 RepID=UPI000E0CEFA8|nr:lysylphosphatidylglycerol synthase domain-containing protein [Kordia sp. SMS9]AXG69653.1 lysylphosphatidylglycerol synthase TM region [Kordia sp. SMS9]